MPTQIIVRLTSLPKKELCTVEQIKGHSISSLQDLLLDYRSCLTPFYYLLFFFKQKYDNLTRIIVHSWHKKYPLTFVYQTRSKLSIDIGVLVEFKVFFLPSEIDRHLNEIEIETQTFSRKMRSSSGDVKAGLSHVTKTCLMNGSPFRATCPITDLSVGTVRQ